MTYGFKVTTDTGIVQVDDTFANLALIQSGDLSLSQEGDQMNIRYGTLTFSGREAPVVAIRSSYPVGYKAVNVSGSTWVYQLVAELKWMNSTPVRWYLFDRPPPLTSGWGIRVRDAQGREVFNSGNRYMRPKAFYTLPADTPADNNALVDLGGLPPGTYAAIPATCRNAGFAYTVIDTANAMRQLVDGVQALSTGVRVGWVAINDQPYGGDAGFYRAIRPGYVTVVDVDGY